MSLTPEIINKVSNILDKKLTGSHINNATVISSSSFLLSFSKSGRDKLFVDLNPASPYIGIFAGDNPCSTLTGALNETLRKYVRGGFVKSIEQINEDRILQITYSLTDYLFNTNTWYLLLELIPTRTNLIILDSSRHIIFATNYKSLLSSHPIVKGQKYEPPHKTFNRDKKTDVNVSNYQNQIEERICSALEKRKCEQFKPLISKIKSRIKSLTKKEQILQNDLKNATNCAYLKDFADELLTFHDDAEQLKTLISTHENIYDSSLSVFDNASKLYQKYKKEKAKINHDKTQLEVLSSEMEQLLTILNNIPIYTEEDLTILSREIGFNDKLKAPNKKEKNKEKKPLFSYIDFNGVKIAFGKSKEQNNYLTFKYSKPEYTIFHIKGYSGAHVVACSQKINDDIILFACEVALILSNKQEGEVMFEKCKYVKKGDAIGQIQFKTYQTIYLKSIRIETKEQLILNQMVQRF